MPTPAALSFGLTVQHARVVGGAGRRGELERALGAVSLADVVPADEILLIPHLRSTARLREGETPARFAAHFADQLRAVRMLAIVDPARSTGGGSALRFTSKARYIAWLLGHWASGTIRQVAASYPSAPGVHDVAAWQRRIVLPEARLLVAVATRLAEQGVAAKWIARLDQGEIAIAQQALSLAHGMASAIAIDAGTHPAVARAESFKTPPVITVRQSDAGTTAQQIKDRQILGPLHLTAERLARQGNSFEMLDQPQARLLLILQAIAAAPAIAGRLQTAYLDQALASINFAGLPRQAPKAPPQSAAAKTGDPPRILEAGSPLPDAPVPTRKLRADLMRRADDALAPPTSEEAQIAPSFVPERSAKLSEAMPAAVFAPDANFESRYAGLLFLINALLALELYPDFSRPLDPRLEPSPFWLLSRIGLLWFGAAFRRDPLFGWLESNGLAGTLPRRWEIRPEWLAGLPRGRTSMRRSGGRRLWWDSRGFALREVPEGERNQNGRRVPRALPMVRRACGTLGGPGRHWLSRLAEFLAFRLRIAADGLTPQMLALPGRVMARGDQLYVHFALDALPLPVRLAGLDRNPGWLPAEGRAIEFVFGQAVNNEV